MPFVKLDCGILNSTLWFEKDCRDVFMTALLMAEPFELAEPTEQISVDSLERTGWFVPAGWYGFVPAAGVGILHRAQIDEGERGKAALRQLGEPEESSRTSDFDGRRLVRIDGGYLVLNYMKYRDRDYTTAERSKRYRERLASRRDDDVSRRGASQKQGKQRVASRDITQAEVEAEVQKADLETKTETKNAPSRSATIVSPADYDKLTKHNAYVGGRLRVPHKLHSDFIAALGGQEPDTALRGWYALVDAEIEASGEPIVPSVWKWLEARFNHWMVSAAVDSKEAKWAADRVEEKARHAERERRQLEWDARKGKQA